MTPTELAQAVQQWPLAVAIAESTYGFPLIETLHVIAIALVFGSIALVDLRLLGRVLVQHKVSTLTAQVLPWTWTAFGLAVLSGGLMFISKADSYLHNLPFLLKFGCIGLAGLNMLIFHFFTQRDLARWDSGATPASAKTAGALSISLWTAVVLAGRWIGFVG